MLCLLTLGAVAQQKKTVTTRKVTTHYTAQPTMMYFGIGAGQYNYSGTGTFDYTVDFMGTQFPVHAEDTPYEYMASIVGVQGGYLYSLFGDINKSFTPYVGAEGLIGVTPSGDVSLGIQAGLAAGLMLGSPSFRFDFRIQPMLSYFGIGDYYINGDYQNTSYGSSFRPNVAIRGGFWINHFNLYVQYNNTVSAGIAWRL